MKWVCAQYFPFIRHVCDCDVQLTLQGHLLRETVRSLDLSTSYCYGEYLGHQITYILPRGLHVYVFSMLHRGTTADEEPNCKEAASLDPDNGSNEMCSYWCHAILSKCQRFSANENGTQDVNQCFKQTATQHGALSMCQIPQSRRSAENNIMYPTLILS